MLSPELSRQCHSCCEMKKESHIIAIKYSVFSKHTVQAEGLFPWIILRIHILCLMIFEKPQIQGDKIFRQNNILLPKYYKSC